jgi:hypothetical protein
MSYIQSKYGDGDTSQVFDETTSIFGREMRAARRNSIIVPDQRLIDQPLERPFEAPKGRRSRSEIDQEERNQYQNEIDALQSQVERLRTLVLNPIESGSGFVNGSTYASGRAIVYCKNHPNKKQHGRGLCKGCHSKERRQRGLE